MIAYNEETGSCAAPTSRGLTKESDTMAAAVGKRKLDEVAESAVAIFDANKRARENSPGAGGKDVALAVAQIKMGSGALLPAGIKRTSALEAPTMLLTGHSVC